GPSGCGKSTLMRLIGDLDQPSAGGIQVKGKPPRQARLDRDYGIVFQSPVLYDWRTVRKNVELPLEIMGRTEPARQERSQAMLQLVGLQDFGESYPWQLSGGMQQRVSIARVVDIDLPRTRDIATRESSRYFALVTEVRESLRET